MKYFGLNQWFKEHRFKDLLSSDRQISFWKSHLPLWSAAGLVALFSAIYAKLFHFCEAVVYEFLAPHPIWIFVAAPLGFFASRLVVEYICPPARGSGIPQVIAAIHSSSTGDNANVERLLPRNLIWAKVLGSCVAVAGGAATGREGPTLQISATIFRWIDSVLPPSWPRSPQHHLMIAGSAAGLAAAFNAPLGGVVFAIEELGREHLNLFRSSLLQAVIVAGLGAQILLGGYLFFGHPQMPSFSLYSTAQVIAVAIAAALLAAVFTEILLWTNRQLRFPSRRMRLIVALTGGLLFAGAAWMFGPIILGSGKPVIQQLMLLQNSANGPDVLARLLGSILTYSSGVVGGVFVPAMAAGATLGSFIGELFGQPSNLLILAGMAAFLTSTAGTPFTSAVLVGEMAGAADQMLFLMLSTIIAHAITRMVRERSFYEILAEDFMPMKAQKESLDRPKDS